MKMKRVNPDQNGERNSNFRSPRVISDQNAGKGEKSVNWQGL
jgi:hypothetical protein